MNNNLSEVDSKMIDVITECLDGHVKDETNMQGATIEVDRLLVDSILGEHFVSSSIFDGLDTRDLAEMLNSISNITAICKELQDLAHHNLNTYVLNSMGNEE